MADRGRPSVYTKEIADEICRRLAEGESLRAICDDDPDMPATSTVRLWAIEDREGFFAQYDKARKVQALGWAEEIMEIADLEKQEVTRSRLRVDTRKWMLSKVLPKVYGEKIGLDGGSVVVVTRDPAE